MGVRHIGGLRHKTWELAGPTLWLLHSLTHREAYPLASFSGEGFAALEWSICYLFLLMHIVILAFMRAHLP
jgi:hypothetical protein